jgi:hypothetical protein
MGLMEHTPIHEYQDVLLADQHLAGLDEVGRLEALKKISLTIEQVMTSQKQTREAAKIWQVSRIQHLFSLQMKWI